MDDMGEWVNEVRLVGRVSAVPQERELPSGDTVVLLRVVVPRLVTDHGSVRVDTIDVACWTPRTRRSASRLTPDVVVEIGGSLRRRFFRAGAATVSRYEVEAARVVVVRKAALPRAR